MKSSSTISGSEVLLGVIAIRLAMLVLAGWTLLLLPRQTHDGELACVASSATRIEAKATPKPDNPQLADRAFDDMLMHD